MYVHMYVHMMVHMDTQGCSPGGLREAKLPLLNLLMILGGGLPPFECYVETFLKFFFFALANISIFCHITIQNCSLVQIWSSVEYQGMNLGYFG